MRDLREGKLRKGQLIHISHLVLSLEQKSANFFSEEGQIVNTLDLTGSATSIQLCHLAQKQPWAICKRMDMAVFP